MESKENGHPYEGKRRDVARRRLAGAGGATSSFRAASEPELICRPGGFPPGTTVDELHWYSRRRPYDASTNRDNLYLESGSLKDITSEYTRCFKAPPVVARSLGDIAKDIEDEKENENIRRYSSHSEDLFGNPLHILPNPEYRHRRYFPSQEGLRLEGDMLFHTEKGDQYTEYALCKRPELLRRNTQLFLEGSIEGITENQDKFVNYENCKRPPLAKRDTNLHLEGDLTYLPEYKEVFVDFPRHRPVIKRPLSLLRVENDGKMNSHSETLDKFIEHAISGKRSEVFKRPSNLKCEGDLYSLGEYKASYKEYPGIERRASIRQTPSLKLEGDLYTTPEYKAKYTGLPMVKLPANRVIDNTTANANNIDHQAPNSYAKSLTDPLHLQFKPEDSINMSTDHMTRYGKAKFESPMASGYNLRTNDKFEKKLSGLSDIHPATPSPSSPHEDRLTSRPPRSQRSRTYSQTAYVPGRNSEDKIVNETKKKSEFETKYINHGTIRRSQPMKRPESIVMDGNYECQPEYRKAYVDYLIREKLPRYHPVDEIQTEKATENPVETNIAESTQAVEGKESTTEEKQQGQINNKNSLPLYKPSTRRRASISSNKSSPRRRSASPSYRLHVTNVDEPKKGFGGTSSRRNPETHKHGGNTSTNMRITSRPVSPYRNSNQKAIDPMHPLKQTYRRQWEKNYPEPTYNATYPNSNYIPSDNKSFVVLDRSVDKNRTGNNWEPSNWYHRSHY